MEKDVPISDGGVGLDVVNELLAELISVVTRVVDHARVPDGVEVGVLAEESALDLVTSEVILPSDVEGLMDITNEVDEESDGRGERRVSIVRPDGKGELLGLGGVVLDGTYYAELVGAISGGIREVSRSTRHVDVVKRSRPLAGLQIAKCPKERQDRTFQREESLTRKKNGPKQSYKLVPPSLFEENRPIRARRGESAVRYVQCCDRRRRAEKRPRPK